MTGKPELLWDHLADKLLANLEKGLLRASTLMLMGVATRQYLSRDAYLTMVANGLQNLGCMTPEHRRLSVPTVAAVVDGPYRLLHTLGAFDANEHAYERWRPGTKVGAASAHGHGSVRPAACRLKLLMLLVGLRSS